MSNDDLKTKNEPFRALPREYQDGLKESFALSVNLRNELIELSTAANTQAVFADEILQFLQAMPDEVRGRRENKRIEGLCAAMVSTLGFMERASWRAEEDMQKLQEGLPDFGLEQITGARSDD